MRFPWKVTADEEFKKDSKLKKEDVKSIQDWLKSLEYMPCIDDEMVCHFLHACFYNVEQCKKTIETFYNYKNTMPEFFNDWDTESPELRETIDNILLAAPLREPDSNGYRVIILKLNDTSVEKFVYPACVRWMTMSCIHILWERGIQPGYVIVYDAAGYTMSHFLKCSLLSVKNYINYGKNASPIRVVKIVFINTSPVIKKLIAIVKPFLNKDLVNMMSFHTSPDTFFQDFPKHIIPEDYGGNASPLLTLHRESSKIIRSNREWLLEEEKNRIDESKKNKKKGRKDSIKVEGSSFTKLEID